ncbi:uncharacterized protein LOC111778598 isoform X2 [Cucurbita pepo subsp. pepo]|uniref:Uncharacterized protein LOC111494361 isoform X2 n=1 Tax=Cucurbita maxima TaxID=3661 RepID=A0A6J1KIU3_CUCMA|nr:uncharacterized protein LOC111494361 isoform X2 [Cucurbita maxima]XP_023514281.1 uncharacterized protein LOC111778598 isoform X2 [Cucurbita pepo subsp. pepo]
MADHQSKGGENYFPFHQNQEATAVTGNRYGGLAPKKKPLISKDHERAFFDSADWALCKRTPKPQLPPRRPVCTFEKGNIVE